jgi:hypothetical protein
LTGRQLHRRRVENLNHLYRILLHEPVPWKLSIQNQLSIACIIA